MSAKAVHIELYTDILILFSHMIDVTCYKSFRCFFTWQSKLLHFSAKCNALKHRQTTYRFFRKIKRICKFSARKRYCCINMGRIHQPIGINIWIIRRNVQLKFGMLQSPDKIHDIGNNIFPFLTVFP